MKIPTHIQFKDDSEEVLRNSLFASAPQEGCALLLGKQSKFNRSSDNYLSKISLIWPCSNIWEPGKEVFPETSPIKIIPQRKPSKENRFAIDPREQLLAQKWARANQISIIGSAHSHPSSDAIPSKLDLYWKFSPGLMIIISGSGEIRAWWIRNPRSLESKEIPILPSIKAIIGCH